MGLFSGTLRMYTLLRHIWQTRSVVSVGAPYREAEREQDITPVRNLRIYGLR